MAAFVLTQPLGRVESIRDALLAAGHDCLAMPFSALYAHADGLSVLARLAPADHDRIVFVSPAAVAFAAAALGTAWQDGDRVCAVGAGTTEALHEHAVLRPGTQPIMPPRPPYDADSLMPLIDTDSVHSLLVVKGEGGRRDWLDALRAHGKRVTEVIVYGSHPVLPDAGVVDALATRLGDGADVATLLSSRAAISAMVGWQPLSPLWSQLTARPALAVHPNVADRAREAGFRDLRLLQSGQSLLAGAVALAAQM
ncbi:MAG: uroporphyrinogen-III synthase [Burkholderiaceae bacterium]